MKHGDFTKLAKSYINRPGYSLEILELLYRYIEKNNENFKVADVGAGTGKLTENLSQIGLTGFAVEPNDAMREEGKKLFENSKAFIWSKGTAEITELEDSSVDWVLMGSSFHWTDTELALKEFHRILKPGGFFTAIWNPRDINKSKLDNRVEEIIHEIVPDLKRVSSGSSKNMHNLEEKLISTGDFHNLVFCEAPHTEIMSKDRYIGVWRSVNDIQVQAGPERFEKIMDSIEKEISNIDHITARYKTRAWTVQAKVKK